MTKPPHSFVLSGNPALLFVVTTAMATTVATAISTVLWTSRDAEPTGCACTCEQSPATAPSAPVQALVLEGRGTLDRAAIRAVVHEHIGDIRDCYNEGLRADAALEGRVSIALTIAEDGQTRDVRADSATLPSTPIVECIVEAVDGWRFPTPEGGTVEVVYPFVLEPG